MIEPIRLSFEVDCPVEHAFEVWTAGIARWWPTDHTVSAEADLMVVLEGRAGGRIFERRANGAEHDWGEVTVWEPPRRLGYTWHLNRDRSDATDVEVRFMAEGDAATAWRSSTAAGNDLAPGVRLARPQPGRLVHLVAALCGRVRCAGGPGLTAWRGRSPRPTLPCSPRACRGCPAGRPRWPRRRGRWGSRRGRARGWFVPWRGQQGLAASPRSGRPRRCGR